MLAQNGIPTTVDMHIKALDELGGLDVLGTPKVENQYHAGWGWAGSTPYKGTKLLASHFGGTRNPMAVRWPAKIKPDATPRAAVPPLQRRRPHDLRGRRDHPAAGGQRRPAGPDRRREPRLHLRRRRRPKGAFGPSTSRSWAAARSTTTAGWPPRSGPRLPWVPGLPPGIGDWTPDQDTWELYDLDQDWSQAHDLADRDAREAGAAAGDLFTIEAARNSVYPIGGGLWIPILHPELRISTPYREWNFTGDIVRMPEFCAPALGNRANVVTIDLDIPADPAGVLYALGGAGGGLTCYIDDGILCFEYNTFIVMRTKIRADRELPAGTARSRSPPSTPSPARRDRSTSPSRSMATRSRQGLVPVSAPLLFTANDCLDIGTCLGSPVSLDYYDRAPFPFNGIIDGNARQISNGLVAARSKAAVSGCRAIPHAGRESRRSSANSYAASSSGRPS